eukprot:CAMPEP_0195033224 /NCGR_PEP_ID=MMETSP0326_2-20130528/65093_1 /TAXON_ID=2866 ORGANISM="Crypthecodinium cohnii, Strain Seligo" /NCGR_SAMPLE_ID=MMETSP0326_2 /ASSEMBLY_ACC=CAM_ASM_000348 /LENGTH=31 /DNA_ID= /DNA_START= /DNA_END= /DNA_ORIENTATION=
MVASPQKGTSSPFSSSAFQLTSAQAEREDED